MRTNYTLYSGLTLVIVVFLLTLTTDAKTSISAKVNNTTNTNTSTTQVRFPTCYNFINHNVYGRSRTDYLNEDLSLPSNNNLNFDSIIETYAQNLLSNLLNENLVRYLLTSQVGSNSDSSTFQISNVSFNYPPLTNQNVDYYFFNNLSDQAEHNMFISTDYLQLTYTQPMSIQATLQMASGSFDFSMNIETLSLQVISASKVHGTYDFKNATFLGRQNTYAGNAKNNSTFTDTSAFSWSQSSPKISLTFEGMSDLSIESDNSNPILNQLISNINEQLPTRYIFTINQSLTQLSNATGAQSTNIPTAQKSLLTTRMTEFGQLLSVLSNRYALLNIPPYSTKENLTVEYILEDSSVLTRICDRSSNKMSATNPNPTLYVPSGPYVRNGVYHAN